MDYAEYYSDEHAQGKMPDVTSKPKFEEVLKDATPMHTKLASFLAPPKRSYYKVPPLPSIPTGRPPAAAQKKIHELLKWINKVSGALLVIL